MALPIAYSDGSLWEKDRCTEDEYFAWEARMFGRWEWQPNNAPDPQGRCLMGVVKAIPAPLFKRLNV